MLSIRRLRAALCVVALAAIPVPLAAAQAAGDILRKSSDALVEAKTLRAKLSIHGDGAEMFKSAMPVGEVTLLLRREPGDEQENIAPGWTSRITGSTTTGNAQDKKPVRVDIVSTGGLLRWTDHEQKKLFESPPDRAITTRSPGYAAARSLLLVELLTAVPFSGELEAEELALLEPAEVHGVLCDIVEVTYPQKTARTSRATTHNVARIAIGRDDHLPRRIERVSGADAFSMSIVLELTELEPGEEIPDADFEMPLPEGYELAESMQSRVVNPTARVTTARNAEGPGADAEVENRPEELGEIFPPAPDFTTPLASGDELSLESLRGSVGVLYFWGTWSMECRPYGPLVSTLADDYRERGVRVVGMAVRERNPDFAVNAARALDYTFEVAPDATATTEPFGVVVFPTFAVITADGSLIGTERMRRGVEPAEVLDRVRGLIDKALALNEPAADDQTETEEPQADEPQADDPADDDQP